MKSLDVAPMLTFMFLCFHCISGLRNNEPQENDIPCIYDGVIKTDLDWYGFLANVSIIYSGRIAFDFSYPVDRCCPSILFYMEEQISLLGSGMNCWQKESLLRHEDQFLRLTPLS